MTHAPLVTVRDHALILDRYRALGFRPSPVSYHPWGTVTATAAALNGSPSWNSTPLRRRNAQTR